MTAVPASVYFACATILEPSIRPLHPRHSFLPILAVVLWAFAGAAGAKLCGDDVQGHDVPCACGDTVVSDLVLTSDPVTRTVCPANGLIVRAASANHGVTIDLRGKTLRGSGYGVGVLILYGGPGGARLISTGRRARINGFMDGIVAHGTNAVSFIEDIVVQRSVHDGVRIQAPDYAIRRTETRACGGVGFSLSGRHFTITSSRAIDSGHFGYSVMGKDGTLGISGAGNTALRSGQIGFSLTGTGHRLVDCAAAESAKEGVRLNGTFLTVTGCVAERNGSDGIVGMGGDWWISGNHATGNGKNGIVVGGSAVLDGGGNSGTDNGGWQRPDSARQCEISGVACAH